MKIETESSSNEEILSSGISSMSDDSLSLENGLSNEYQQTVNGTIQQQRDVTLDRISDRFPDRNDFLKKQFPVNNMSKHTETIPVTMLPRENGVLGPIGGFLPIDNAYSPFADAGKGYFLDSDLETIEEESSVLESDFDDRSSIGYGRKKSSNDCNRSLLSSISSSTYMASQRSSLTSSANVSDDEQSSSTLSSGRYSSPSNPSDPGSMSNDYTEKQNRMFMVEMQNGHDEAIGRRHEIGAIDPNVHQKIVYAKCMSPEEERRHIKLSYVPKGPEYNFVNQRNGFSLPVQPVVNPVSLSARHRKSTELTITDMFEAVRRGDLQTLKRFSTTEQSETVDEQGNTVLHAASSTGQLECVKFLAGGPCVQSVSMLNDDRMSPTALSVQHGHLRCVQWLVENTAAKEELIVSSRQASIDGTNMRPPLAHVAARRNQDAVLDWLCEQMAKENFPVDSADHYSNTAVHEAAAYGHLKCLQTLVGRGASVTVLNSNGDTPGQVADKNGHDLCVGYLVVVETCMSLAQQLITIKLENEGLSNDNSALRNQVQAMHNAKLAYAKETVEERIRATLQSLSSYEEDNENRSPVIQAANSPKNVSVVPDVTDQPPAENSSTQILPEKISQKMQPKDKSLQMSARFAVSNKSNISTTLPGNYVSQLDASKESGKQSSERSEKPVLNSVSKNTSNDVREPDENPRTSMSVGNHSTKQNTSEDDGVHSEVRKINKAADHISSNGHEKQFNASSDAPQKPAKQWEKMAMDEVIRLARDSRYLPSPTISMCTEDSTMETKEVMKDRLSEASKWFLVQQAGQPRIKDAMIPTQRMRPLHSGAAFQRPSQRSVNSNTSRHHKNRTDNSGAMRVASMTQQKMTLPQSLVAATNQQYQALQQENVSDARGNAVSKPKPYLQASTASSVTSNSSSLPEKINYSVGVRPTSAKSTASTTSTIKSDTSKSTVRSQDTVIYGQLNSGKLESSGYDPLQKRRLPTGSPSSIMVQSRPSSARTPSNTIQTFDSSSDETAQVRVALPTRNNSFLRKVQSSSHPDQSPHSNYADTNPSAVVSYPSITTRSPSKQGANSSPSLKSPPAAVASSVPISPEKSVPQRDTENPMNGFVPISPGKVSMSATGGYVMWKPSAKTTTRQPQSKESERVVAADDSARSVTEKSKKAKSLSKLPYGGLFSSNSPKVSGKKKATKLFHF